MTPTSIVAYMVLFAAVGFLFLLVTLTLGWFVRAKLPTPEKLETYECGEPAIGSSFVQFDLRFYVVALVFLIFDVEVAFFFPWATVFGKATQLMDPSFPLAVAVASAPERPGVVAAITPEAAAKLSELGVRSPSLPDPSIGAQENASTIRAGASKLALAAMADIGVFFGVLLVGFAYVWKMGDLDWVRPAGSREPQT